MSTPIMPLVSKTYSEAIRLHEKVLRENPNDALAHYHLGFAYGMSHDAAGELREYLRAQELGLRQWDLFLNLGLVHLQRNDFRAAVDTLRTAARLGPQHAETHLDLGLAYERVGLLPQAVAEILASLELEPNQPDAQNTLAVIHAE
jgi:Flp pilus assembly protein TadD